MAGIMHAMDAALHPDRSTRELIRPAVHLDPQLPALEAIRLMRADRAQLAIVQAEGASNPLGVVALKEGKQKKMRRNICARCNTWWVLGCGD